MDGLTKADIQKIREALVLTQDADQTFNRMKACNIDCDGMDERCQHARETCQLILKTYGPMFPAYRDNLPET